MNVIKETTGIQLDGFDIERIIITNKNNIKIKCFVGTAPLKVFMCPTKMDKLKI